MNRRLLVPIVFAGMVLASGVASANPTYWRQNGLLLEVSADPRDGRDFVRVDATTADRLELIALQDTVTLEGITVRFADGNAMTRRMRHVQPGRPMMLDLPDHAAAVVGVELDYGHPAHRRYDRTPARLQIVPHHTRWRDDHHHQHARHRGPHRDGYYYAPQSRQPIRPRRAAGWSGSIRGTFRL